MFDFLTYEELLRTAEVLRAEISLREEGIKVSREPLGVPVSGHDYVGWVMKLTAVEEEIKEREFQYRKL